VLFVKIVSVYFYLKQLLISEMDTKRTSTVPIVSTHFRSLSFDRLAVDLLVCIYLLSGTGIREPA